MWKNLKYSTGVLHPLCHILAMCTSRFIGCILELMSYSATKDHNKFLGETDHVAQYHFCNLLKSLSSYYKLIEIIANPVCFQYQSSWVSLTFNPSHNRKNKFNHAMPIQLKKKQKQLKIFTLQCIHISNLHNLISNDFL